MYKKQTAFILIICVLLVGSVAIASTMNSKELKMGTYNAKASQTSEYLDTKNSSEVEVKIKIDSISSDGNVRGEFIHSTLCKCGKGGLTGRIIDSKKLQLKGSLTSKFGDVWQVNLTATIGNKTLTDGQYRLEARTLTLTGHFNMAELEDDN